MKTCVVRKRLEPKTSGSYNFDIQLPKNFGIPKCGIAFYTNGTQNDAFDESSLNRVFGIGFFGYSYANPASLVAYTSGMGFTHSGIAGTQAKAVSGTSIAGRIAYEIKTDRNVIRQCNIISVGQDKFTVNLVWTSAATSFLDIIFVVFGGEDIQANLGVLGLSITANGTASATGLSYSPDVIFTMGSGFGFTNYNADARLTFGCATKSGGIKNNASLYRMRSNAIGASGLASTSVQQFMSTDSCFVMSTAFQNNLVRANVSSFNSDGFTVTSQTSGFLAGSTNGMVYLAIKGLSPDDFNLQNFSSSTSSGVSAIATSTFIPQLIIGALSSVTSTGATVTSNDSTGYSVFAIKSLTSKNNFADGTISVSSGTTSVTGSGTGFSILNVGDIVLSSTNNLVGIVSEVVNSTNLFLVDNSPITLSSDNFSYRPYQQFSASIASSHLSTTTKIASSISQSSIKVVKYGVSAGISTVIKADVNNFDSYPGLKINYNTVDASSRKGWFLAIKDTELRRRDSN